MSKFDGLEPIDYLRGIRDGNIIPTLENLKECLRTIFPYSPQNARLPICCITGRIAGDALACGDCDPCGAAHVVPEAVKAIIKERDEWADKYAGAMMDLDEARLAVRQ